jgi:L,D-transpeptidase ErfK/SrfK
MIGVCAGRIARRAMYGITSNTGKLVLLHALAIALASAALCGAGRQLVPSYGTITGGRWIHLVSAGETWSSVGARAGVAPAVLAARNQRTLRVPLKPGDVLGIDNRHVAPPYERDEILINLPQRMLFHYWGGTLRIAYPVAVGQPTWQTPLGPFSIVEMEVDPTWDVPVSIQEEMRRAGKPVLKNVPPGPSNPLGRYWLRLSLGSIGLHGTAAPSSIYQFATHGCIRLHPDDVEDLFMHVAIGEPGRIVYEPVLVGFDGTDVFLEVHRDAYRRGIDLPARVWQRLHETGLRDAVDPELVARVVREAEGLAVPVTGPTPRWQED